MAQEAGMTEEVIDPVSDDLTRDGAMSGWSDEGENICEDVMDWSSKLCCCWLGG